MDQILGHFSVTETDLIRQPENYKQVMLLLWFLDAQYALHKHCEDCIPYNIF